MEKIAKEPVNDLDTIIAHLSETYSIGELFSALWNSNPAGECNEIARDWGVVRNILEDAIQEADQKKKIQAILDELRLMEVSEEDETGVASRSRGRFSKGCVLIGII